MYPSASPRETLRVSGKQNLLFPFGPVINCLMTKFYVVRELKQRLQRRRGRRLEKNEFIFYKRNSRLSRSVPYTNSSKRVIKLNMQWRRSISNGNTKNWPWSSMFAVDDTSGESKGGARGPRDGTPIILGKIRRDDRREKS